MLEIMIKLEVLKSDKLDGNGNLIYHPSYEPDRRITINFEETEYFGPVEVKKEIGYNYNTSSEITPSFCCPYCFNGSEINLQLMRYGKACKGEVKIGNSYQYKDIYISKKQINIEHQKWKCLWCGKLSYQNLQRNYFTTEAIKNIHDREDKKIEQYILEKIERGNKP